jgi:hypothetical protein
MKISKCARLVSHTSPYVCMLNISQIKYIAGYSGSFYVNGPYFKTFYFILKWVKARNLPHFIFIVLSFKMVVATPRPIRSSLRACSAGALPFWKWGDLPVSSCFLSNWCVQSGFPVVQDRQLIHVLALQKHRFLKEAERIRLLWRFCSHFVAITVVLSWILVR